MPTLDFEIAETVAYALKGDHFHKLVERAFRKEKGRYFVYSWFRCGECLYVGSSRNLARRFRYHDVLVGQDQVQRNDTIFVEPCNDWLEATILERCLIKLLRPKYNVTHNSRRKPFTITTILTTRQKELERLNDIARTVYPDGLNVA